MRIKHSIALALASLLASLGLLANAGAGAVAQEYPVKSIRVIVGGGPDVVARAIGQKLTAAWGQAVVVEQLPGAGGLVAAQTVARAPADGYTLLLTSSAYAIMPAIQPKFQYNLVKDFEPIAQIASLGFVLLAHHSVAANSLDELVKLAQAKPGFINCGSVGAGSTAHLGCEILKTYAKVDIVHVPYNGAGPALLDLLAGRIHIFLSPGTDFSNVKAGKLKVLAITGSRRIEAVPEVPTMAEAGRPELSFESWNGFHAPGGTPKAVVAKLAAEILKAAATPEVQEKVKAQGFFADPRSGDAFAEFVKADVARWARIVAETGARPE